MVSWRSFNITGTFLLHKRFFAAEKKTFFRLLKCSSHQEFYFYILRFFHSTVDWETQNGSSIALLWILVTLTFKSEKMFILRTDDWKVDGSKPSLWKSSFWTFIIKCVLHTISLSYRKATLEPVAFHTCLCVWPLAPLFMCPWRCLFGELPCEHLSPPQERGLECVCCGRTPSGRGKCSCAAASLWHANRAFLSAGRVVPMHIALREIGGLHHSSGKFWDQQITVLLPPLTCRHWAAPFSLSLSLCVPLRTMCSVSLSTFLWPSQAIFYLSVRFFILALLLSQLSFYCRTVSKQRPPPVLYAGVIVTSQFSLSVILPTHTVEALIFGWHAP